MFGHHVSLVPLAIGGCPEHHIIGKDSQSDKEASSFMSPAHLLVGTFDDIGLNLLQFLVGTLLDL